MILNLLADATAALDFSSLGLSPIALDLGSWRIGGTTLHPQVHWYSLGYIVGYAELLRSVSRVADALTNAQYLLPLLTVGAAVYIALNISLSRLAVFVQRRSSFARKAPTRVVGTPPIP